MSTDAKLKALDCNGEFDVLDRKTGEFIGSVQRRTRFGLVTWKARNAAGEIIAGHLDGQGWLTRRVAVAQVVGAHDGEPAPATDAEWLFEQSQGKR